MHSLALRPLAFVLLLLTAALSSAQTVSPPEAEEAPLVTELVYASPSRLVEIEPGRRINLYCLGAGSPTVVFDSGLGGGTTAWAPVQAKVAKTNRACSYDRAGLYFSDPSPRPSSSANIVDDLHRTLAAAGIAPPYVMVGHSYGGLNVRLFATTYPTEVAGMVLVDPVSEDQREVYRLLDPKKPTKEEWDRQDYAKLDRLGKCEGAASLGFVDGTEIYSECRINQPNSLYGPEINAAYAKLKLQPGYWRTLRSEEEVVFRASADQVSNSNRNLGSLPLIVLTRSPAPKRDTETQAVRDERNQVWVKMHDQIAALSKRGVNRIVPDSGHAIQFDQPQVVIDAILEITRASSVTDGLGVSGNHEGGVYRPNGGGHSTELRVLSIEHGKLTFEYFALNSTGASARVAGVALLEPAGDTESLVDEQGSGFDADDFRYRSGRCALTFRISADARQLARVTEEGCATFDLHQSAFETVLLHRQE